LLSLIVPYGWVSLVCHLHDGPQGNHELKLEIVKQTSLLDRSFNVESNLRMKKVLIAFAIIALMLSSRT